MKALELLLSDSRGIYIPMTFAQECLGYPSNPENGWEFSENCAEVLLRGPEDNDDYWDAWNAMLDRAIFKLEGGTWRLYQDGDLWAYNWDWMSVAERVNWMDALGMEHGDLYELTGTSDDRAVVEEYLNAIDMHPDDWKWEEYGYHSLRLSILNGDGQMGWRDYTFGADFQYNLAKACEFRKSMRARGF